MEAFFNALMLFTGFCCIERVPIGQYTCIIVFLIKISVYELEKSKLCDRRYNDSSQQCGQTDINLQLVQVNTGFIRRTLNSQEVVFYSVGSGENNTHDKILKIRE